MLQDAALGTQLGAGILVMVSRALIILSLRDRVSALPLCSDLSPSLLSPSETSTTRHPTRGGRGAWSGRHSEKQKGSFPELPWSPMIMPMMKVGR